MTSWRDIDRPLILASRSPRRQQILTLMGLRFSVIPSTVAEEDVYIRARDLDASMQELARAKALSVARRRGKALVLGADTIVVCDGHVLGKPRNAEDAGAMLRLLAGRVHLVYSAVALMCRESSFCHSSTAATAVYFRSIGDDELAAYLALGEYADKAGAYAIQGAAMQFIDKIEGCYYNVVGLPVTATINLFKEYAARKERGNG